MNESKTQFNTGAEAWASYNREPLGRIRREVTWYNLALHLPPIAHADDPPCVLDAGGGTGELAVRLAECGYQVWLLDCAPAMLDEARKAAQELPDVARARLSFCLMDAEEAPRSFAPGTFDVITCHTLIEYVPEPRRTLCSLAGLLRDGGLLSLSFRNRHGARLLGAREALRQTGSRGDPAGALATLENGAFCASLFNLPGMAYTTQEACEWLGNLGLAVSAVCGVRLFADFVPSERLKDPEFFDILLRLEKAVASRPPYMLLARYVHLLSHKRDAPLDGSVDRGKQPLNLVEPDRILSGTGTERIFT
jgi:S-adenosylmethionine-dependent methyltransferase